MSPRHTARTIFCLLLAAAAPLSAGVNRWTRIGPEGGTVTALAAAPSRPGLIYAGTRGGVFRSPDAGRTWIFAGPGPFGRGDGDSLAVHPRIPTIAYAGTASGLFKTTDAGASWTQVAGVTGPVSALAINPRSPRILFAAVFGGPLSRSEDGGVSWTVPPSAPANVFSIAIAPARPQTVYAASPDAGAFKSTDGGKSWARLTRGLPAALTPLLVVVDPRQPQRLLLAGRFGQGLYRSSDGGATWRPSRGLGADVWVHVLAFDPAASLAYAVTSGQGERFWRSTDGGATWKPASAAPLGFFITALVPSRFGLLAGEFGRGVFASVDRGASWRESNKGLSALVVSGFAIADQDPPRLYAGDSDAGLFKSADRGAHWLRLPTNFGFPKNYSGPVAMAAHDPLTVYAGFTQSLGTSDNGGRRWSLWSAGCLQPSRIVPDPHTPGALYLVLVRTGVGCQVGPGACSSFKLSPDGIRCLRDPLRNFNGAVVEAVDPHAPGHLYAVYFDGIYHSLDDGVTPFSSWSLLAPGVSPSDLTFDRTRPGVVYGGFNGAVGRSGDGGATWSFSSTGLPQVRVHALAIDPTDPSVLYAATASSGVFRSADSGLSWTAVAPGLEGFQVSDVLVDPEDPSILYAATLGASVLSVDQEP
jgi:photosystem II stability/assembly factor-like uncharacterized protein